MAASQACTGLRQASMFGVRQPAASHDIPTCASPVLFARRSVHVRHLGAKPSLGSCRGLASKRTDLRPAVPRQGRLQCHAAKSQVTGTIQCQPLKIIQLAANNSPRYVCADAEPVQATQGDGRGAESIGRLTRRSILWSCPASGHSCWCMWICSWRTCPRCII